MNTIVTQVVEAAGGAAALARHLGITSQAISQWSRIPSDRVIPIERLLRGRVTRYQMRPDLYPQDERATG